MYVSINAAIINIISINIENIVCLTISIFTFSLLLSFTIDLYSFSPLTASDKTHGINIRFCNNIDVRKNIVPSQVPYVKVNDIIVYPKQKPLYATIPNTSGIPITVEPVNHMIIHNITFFHIELVSNAPLSIV